MKKKQNSGYANFALRDGCAFMCPFSVLLITYQHHSQLTDLIDENISFETRRQEKLHPFEMKG